MNLGAVHILRPAALLLLFALPLFWLRWRARRTSAGAWREAVDAHLLPHLLERGEAGSARGALALAALLWTLAAVALAGPAWDHEPMPLFRNQAARVLALELAPTMLAQDEKPDRLARARYKLDDILDRSRDLQTALIGYAGEAFIAAPLTDDVGTVRNLVDALDPSTMPVPGNATSKAIDAGVALIEQAGLHGGEILLLADSADAGAIAAARRALDHGVRVSVLGIGSAGGAPVALAQGGFLKDAGGNVVLARLDESALRGVAEAGGGRYAALTPDAADLDALLGSVSSPADPAGAMPEDAAGSRWRDRGPWFVLLLLPLALAGFRRGWLLVLACSIAWPGAPAHAMSLDDFWQRPDQQAAAALARGDAKRAADVAATPAWRGGAAYRGGDYTRALEAYAQTHDADGAYDRGNALAKLGRYQEAIAAYDEALRLAPGMEDARANRKAVEDFLKRQQEKSSPQQGDKGDAQDRQKQDGEPQKSPGSQQQPGDTGDPSQGAGQAPRPDSDAAGNREQPPADAKAKEAQQPSGKTDGQSASQAPDAAQQQALSQSIDRALAKDPKAPDARAPADAKAVREEDDATREQRQALDNLLQRVPDDPGGLLRRKFQLEYQRRQQQGEGR